jgi:hypothetical protein
MTFQELTVNIRDLHNKYSRNPGAPGYNPKTAFVIEFGVGMATLPMYGWSAGQLLCQGYTKGALNNLPPFESLRTPEIGDAARLGNGGKMIRSIVSWLEDRGHKVSGTNEATNPFDRLADALEQVAARGIKVNEAAVELNLDRSRIYALIKQGRLMTSGRGKVCERSVADYKKNGLKPNNKRRKNSAKAKGRRNLSETMKHIDSLK